MHVLAVTDYLNNVGGAEISAKTIVRGLTSIPAIDRVSVVGIDLSGHSHLDYGEASVHSVSLPRSVDSIPDLISDSMIASLLGRKITKLDQDIDIIHAHHRRATHAVAYSNSTTPCVSTVRDYWPTCPISVYSIGEKQCTGCENDLDECLAYQGWNGIDEQFRRMYLKRKRERNRERFNSDYTVFISEFLKDTIEREETIDGHSTVIYNPVDIPSIEVGEDRQERTLVTASRLSAVKGIDTAIHAVAALVERYPDLTLSIYGDGPERSELEDIVQHLGIEDNVTFHGKEPVETVYEAMASATATVFPSLWQEPFGRVTVESWLLGTPVIGSDVGGIGELIQHGDTGYVFSPGNHKELANHIQTLLETPERCEKMGKAGRTFAERFRPSNVAAAYTEVYSELLSSKSSTSG